MKKGLLSLLFLFVFQLSAQQVSRIDQFKAGTKISYFMGQCGQEVPEAQGKLTFCDANGNLGAVMESTGLSDVDMFGMMPNYFDDAEMFLTGNGISMRRADGSWENIPARAVPTTAPDGSVNNLATITSGLVDPTGLLHLMVSNDFNSAEYWLYDPSTKTFEQVPLATGLRPLLVTYRPADQSVIVFVDVSGPDRLYRRDQAGNFSQFYEFNAGTFTNGFTYQTSFEVSADSLYLAGVEGLLALDLTSFGTKLYDNTQTGILPFDWVPDVAFGADGALWLAQADENGFEGSIVRLAPETRTLTSYTLPYSDFPDFNLPFAQLEVFPNGNIAATSLGAFSLFDLDWQSSTANWTSIPLDSLIANGIPFDQLPTQLDRFNDKLYYTVGLGAGVNNSMAEVLVRANQTDFTTRNDNTPTNISKWEVDGYDLLLPDRRGGIHGYSFASSQASYIDPDEQFRSYTDRFYSFIDPTINEDDNLIFFGGGSPFEWTELDDPLSLGLDAVTDLRQSDGFVPSAFGNTLHFFNRFNREYIRVIDGTIIDQDTLPFPPTSPVANFATHAVGDDGIAWLATRVTNLGTTEIVRYEPTTNDFQFYELNVDISDIERILPAPDGEVFFVGREGIIHYDGANFSNRTGAEDAALDQIYDGAVDEAGRLWLLTDFVGSIHRIDDFDQDPTGTTYSIDENLPFLNLFGANSLAIDQDGDLWIDGGNEEAMFKITDDLLEPSYRSDGNIRLVSGRVYDDANENGQFDEGEAIPNQLVVLATGDRLEETVTRADGSYSFLVIAGNTDYRLTLPTISRLYTTDQRQRVVSVTSTDQDYPDNDFVITLKDYRSLYVQTANKTGAFGFERDGFENVFTTAITNLSRNVTFRDLELGFVFHYAEENTATLPDIRGIKVTKLTPNGEFLLIHNLAINPETHKWRIRRLPPAAFTTEDVPSATFSTTLAMDTTLVTINLGEITPLTTIMVEIETDRFDPLSTGSTIVYSPARIGSPDLDGNDPVIPGTVIIYPGVGIVEGETPPFPLELDPNSPYVNPEDIYEEPPLQEPAEVYATPPFFIPVLSSFDPNDKLVDGGLPDRINDTDIEQRVLTYTIRFENTGNFSAKDVWIIDTLHPGLDPNSLRVIAASHDVAVDFLPDENLSIARFSFDNIFLPFQDSINDGFVRFQLRTIDNLAINDLVTNQAGIYFDQNPPIITNLVRNRFIEIMDPNATYERINPLIQVDIFPNPADEQLRIQTDAKIINSQLFDLSGRSITDYGEQTQLSLVNIPSGQYLLKLITDQGVVAKQVMIR
ncbi:MAG: T9SS type A sorting domain-containing protein [Bacteroidota bacterium]